MENIEISLLLEGIYRHYGYDFRDYVFSTIRRRILHRMQKENISSISGLQEKVLHNPDFMQRLLNDFSIHVTEMFRDPGFFKAFREKVVPCLRLSPLVRIWHAGCSSGEEVYSMAILLHEEGLAEKSIIYATDINDDLLIKAKEGVYPLQKMQAYTLNYQQAGGKRPFSEYYTVHNQGAVFHSFLKRNMVYSQHNLVSDSSFNEFNVIICRNVMIYFNLSLQNRVHRLLYESLGPEGFLVLGEKEGIRATNYANMYREVDAGGKIYRKTGGA